MNVLTRTSPSNVVVSQSHGQKVTSDTSLHSLVTPVPDRTE